MENLDALYESFFLIMRFTQASPVFYVANQIPLMPVTAVYPKLYPHQMWISSLHKVLNLKYNKSKRSNNIQYIP